jgi:hypothetical protein
MGRILKRLLPILGLLLCSVPARATIVNVQTKTFQNITSGTNNTITATGAGHLLVVTAGINSNTPGTISCNWNGTSGGAFTETNGGTDSGGGNATAACFVCNSSSGATSFNVGTTNATTDSIAFYEYSGAATSSCQDGSAALQNNGATTTSPGDPAFNSGSHSGDVVLSVIVSSSPSAITVAGGFTLDLSDATLGSGHAHDITTTSGTFTPAWTTGSGTWCGITLAFLVAGGGTACVPRLMLAHAGGPC